MLQLVWDEEMFEMWKDMENGTYPPCQQIHKRKPMPKILSVFTVSDNGELFECYSHKAEGVRHHSSSALKQAEMLSGEMLGVRGLDSFRPQRAFEQAFSLQCASFSAPSSTSIPFQRHSSTRGFHSSMLNSATSSSSLPMFGREGGQRSSFRTGAQPSQQQRFALNQYELSSGQDLHPSKKPSPNSFASFASLAKSQLFFALEDQFQKDAKPTLTTSQDLITASKKRKSESEHDSHPAQYPEKRRPSVVYSLEDLSHVSMQCLDEAQFIFSSAIASKSLSNIPEDSEENISEWRVAKKLSGRL